MEYDRVGERVGPESTLSYQDCIGAGASYTETFRAGRWRSIMPDLINDVIGKLVCARYKRSCAAPLCRGTLCRTAL